MLSSSVLSLLLSISLIISAISPFSSIEEAFSRLAFLKAKDQDRDSVTFTQHDVHFDLEILDDIEQISENILQLLKKSSDIKPSMGYFYHYFADILNRLLGYREYLEENPEEKGGEIPDITYTALCREIECFREYFEQARTAIYSIFMRPEEINLTGTPKDIADLYRLYATENKIALFKPYSAMFEHKMKNGFSISWDDFLIEAGSGTSEDIGEYMTLTLKGITNKAIESMCGSNMIMRKCELCGGYFKARLMSVQRCCSRLYKDTKTTCYEYASRKQYKDRIKEHPVYQVYIKYYNRLYGRIRNNTVPANTPLRDKLKELRDEYYEKYDSADKNKMLILAEYENKNKELLG